MSKKRRIIIMPTAGRGEGTMLRFVFGNRWIVYAQSVELARIKLHASGYLSAAEEVGVLEPLESAVTTLFERGR